MKQCRKCLKCKRALPNSKANKSGYCSNCYEYARSRKILRRYNPNIQNIPEKEYMARLKRVRKLEKEGRK